MKVKSGSINISNKKKSALPLSKSLKPKVLKPTDKTLNKRKLGLNAFTQEKLSMAIDQSELVIRKPRTKKRNADMKESNKNLENSKSFAQTSIVPKVNQQKTGKLKKQDSPMFCSEVSNSKHRISSEKALKKTKTIKTQVSGSGKGESKPNKNEVDTKKQISIEKVSGDSVTRKTKKSNANIKNTNKTVENIESSQTSRMPKVYQPKKDKLKNQVMPTTDASKSILDQTEMDPKKQLSLDKVSTAVAALLKLVTKQDDKALLALPEPIFMEVECIKIPVCPTKQLRFKLPNSLIDELSDVLLITADKKGAKIYPEKAVDYYTELLAKHNINFIQKVIPLRSLTKEYSQYEMRKRLVDQYDLILADAKIIKSLPSRLGKFILYKRKMPIPVHLTRTDLKKHLLHCISKTQMTVKGNGHITVVQVGHTKMGEREVAENILEVAKGLYSIFPGGWKNIRGLEIKTPSSISLPVYFSLATANSVEVPVEKRKVPEPVVGDLSTQFGMRVIVKADGTVRDRRMLEDDPPIDTSLDQEILEDAKKYMQSRKTVYHDDVKSDDSGDEAVTSALEKEILKKYNREKDNENKNSDEEMEEDEEDEDEEDEDSGNEDEPITPIAGKKRKKEHKKQESGPSPKNKKITEVVQQGKSKETPMQKGSQKRGTRGGKKNKLNKSQRKQMLKRNKAGKK